MHIKRIIIHMILIKEEVIEEDMERKITEPRGTNITKEEDMIFIVYAATKMDMMHPHEISLGIESSKNEMKRKVKH